MDNTKRFDSNNYEFNKKSEKGIYLIHGFTNSTYETKTLAEHFSKAGYHTISDNLPGHGTTVDECNRIKYHDWIEFVEQGIARLASTCNQIHVVGNSMGGVLALYLATRFPLDSITVLAPVFKFRSEFKTRILIPLLNKIITKTNKASQYPNGEKLTFYGYSYYPNKALNEFRKLTNLVRPQLSKVKCPTLMIYSKADQTCIFENYHIVNKNISSTIKEQLILNDISHNILRDEEHPDEKQIAWNQISQFIEKF
tara:strand:+ start:288 stop:1049 length:762 start_codon:yes stop_codon:yes gene_type:complete